MPNTTAAGGTTGTISNPTDFAIALLEAIGAPVNNVNVVLVEAWQQAEDQWTASGSFNATNMHNPLNIESVPTSYTGAQPTKLTDGAGNSTLSFPTWTDGVNATAAFLEQYQPKIANALKQTSPGGFIATVGAWDPSNPKYSQGILQNFANIQSGADTWLGRVGAFIGNAANTATFGIPGDIAGAVNSTAGLIGEASTILGDLGNPSWWKRLGIGALGVALVVGGLILFVANTGTGKKIESAAPLAAV